MTRLRQILPVAMAMAFVVGMTLVATGHPGHDPDDALDAANRPVGTNERSRNSLVGDSPDAAATGPSSRASVLAASLTVFVLAIFVGFEVIAKVPPTLHTPLMSGSNAISGITVVGSILVAGQAQLDFATILGMAAVALAMVNVVGGFVVTDRMLRMFKRR